MKTHIRVGVASKHMFYTVDSCSKTSLNDYEMRLGVGMSSGFQISCANKNLNGTIVRLGGEGWSLSHHEAILKINGNLLRLTISIGNESFDIGVRGEGDSAYLVLEPEGKALHELEGLASC